MMNNSFRYNHNMLFGEMFDVYIFSLCVTMCKYLIHKMSIQPLFCASTKFHKLFLAVII